jgi:cytochrome c
LTAEPAASALRRCSLSPLESSMKKLFHMLLAFLAASLFVASASAGEQGTKDEAKALADAAAAYVKKVGVEKAMKDFSTDKATWVKKDLYVVGFDMQGNCLAHGVNEKLIGKNLIEMKDQNGRHFTKEMLDSTKGSGAGWTDYEWPHPETKKLAPKTTYSVRPAGTDVVVGVGFFH